MNDQTVKFSTALQEKPKGDQGTGNKRSRLDDLEFLEYKQMIQMRGQAFKAGLDLETKQLKDAQQSENRSRLMNQVTNFSRTVGMGMGGGSGMMGMNNLGMGMGGGMMGMNMNNLSMGMGGGMMGNNLMNSAMGLVAQGTAATAGSTATRPAATKCIATKRAAAVLQSKHYVVLYDSTTLFPLDASHLQILYDLAK